MRKPSAALMAGIALAAGALGGAQTVDLCGTWRLDAFPQPPDGAVRSVPLPGGIETMRFDAAVPGCCEMELVKAGILPEPYSSTNCFAFREWEGHQWLYTRTFAAPGRAPGEKAMLVFDGIDTLADVFLDGEKIGSPDNMLVPHEYDVSSRLRQGAVHTLQVVIRPVGLASRDRIAGELGGTIVGGADHELFRKAPYMYGWDIMPHLPVSGIWRGVRLEVRAAERIEDVAWIVTEMDREKKTALAGMKCRVVAPFSRLYKSKLRLSLSLRGRTVCSRTDDFYSFHSRGWLSVPRAEFWWPRGMGAQPLYDASVELLDCDGKTVARDVRRIGLRKIALECDDVKLPERPGSFLFRVNGEPVFVRGVNWIPLDPVPSEQMKRLSRVLPMMADLNCNLVRVWGGGVYEPDEFFDWCDENGVMVWQDFMNACAVPPQDPGFRKTMRDEAVKVVRRLRNHASLALWAGDNENDQAAGWSWGRGFSMDPNDNAITRSVLPSVVREYDVTRPYLPSSPYVSRDAFAGRTRPSEEHLWGGGRGWWKTPYFLDSVCWFCSEGGAHGLPSRSSIERMMPPGDAERPWSNPGAESPVDLKWNDQWVLRATNPYMTRNRAPYGRNQIVLKQVAALFGDVPRDDLDLLVAQSQSAQSEAVKFQVELFRSQKFAKRSGFVVWNLADGWPTISDAISDWYGERKRSYFTLKTCYRDVLPIVTEDRRLVVVNDTLAPVEGRIKMVEAKDGSAVFEGAYSVPANAVAEVARLDWSGQGLFRIEYTLDCETLRTHYLHGDPPFAWTDYAAWTSSLQRESVQPQERHMAASDGFRKNCSTQKEKESCEWQE